MSLPKSKSILVPLFGLVAVATLGIFLCLGAAIYLLNESKTADKVEQAHNLVEAARTLVAVYADKVQKGELDEKTAKEMAKASLRSMHYGENNSEYFFVYDDQGYSIAHGSKPEMEGQLRINSADAHGYKYIPDLIQKAKSSDKGGYLYYFFPKKGSTVPSQKITYAVYFAPWNWVICSGLYVDDIEADLMRIVGRLALISGFVIVAVLSLATGLARSIAKPIKALAETATRMSKGDYEVHIPATDRADEIGFLAKEVEILRDEAKAAEQMRRDQETSEERANIERRQEMLRLASHFEASVMGAVKAIVSAVHDNDTAAKSLNNLAGKAGNEATQVASTVDDANRNVQVIAAAAEELLASIREISSQVQHANNVASQAVVKAAETDSIVQGLSNAVARITDVVGLISSVASQTNLLALNATIEAARAGEAGKGFAVVAGEVKSLATQTAKATDEIVAQIESVKGATGFAITAIKEISVTIASVSEVSTSIAAAVEEQSAATNEIARNVSKTAQGVDAVSGFVNRLAGITGEVKDGVVLVNEVTVSLNAQSDILHKEVDNFIAHIKK